MVDIAFLLLIFFLVATTIMPREGDLPMAIPRDGEAVDRPLLPIRLTLDEDGTIWWGEDSGRIPLRGEGRELPGLLELLKPAVASARAAGAGEPPVMLKVSDRAKQQRFIDLLNALADCDVRTVAMVE